MMHKNKAPIIKQHNKNSISMTVLKVALVLGYILICVSPSTSQLLEEISFTTGGNTYVAVTDEYEINLHFLDVGNGDCILLNKGDYNVLIDSGHDYDYTYINSYLRALGIEYLDAVIVSHTDSDHIGSLEYILEDFPTTSLYYSYINDEYNVYEEAWGEYTSLCFVDRGDCFEIGGISFSVLLPYEVGEENNENSLVVVAECEDFSVILTGDIEENQVEYLVSETVDIDVDIYKVPHHGSGTGTTQSFVEKIDPIISVVSVGTENRYLPNADTIDILENNKTLLYQTKDCGTIIISTNGDGSYKVTTEK